MLQEMDWPDWLSVSIPEGALAFINNVRKENLL